MQRIQIFYSLERLREVLGNIIRHDRHRYFVHSLRSGLPDIVPGIGGYFFDDVEFFLGGYWNAVPSSKRSCLRLTGGPFRTFFDGYWCEIWSRGVWLNIHGARDLSRVRDVAIRLGLSSRRWKSFVDEARSLDIGDGAPPRI